MLFSIARAALTTQLQSVCERDGTALDDAYPVLKAHLERMSAEWFSGNAPLITYNDPYCRAAYVYCHVPANANLFLNVIRRLHRANAIVRSDSLKVVAFGGGPGTELLALAKFFAEQRRRDPDFAQVDVQIEIIDYTNEWSESINAIKRAIREAYLAEFGKKTNWPMSMETNFSRLDFLKVESFANVASLFDCDYLVMNYVVSEIRENAPKLVPILKKVFSSEARPRGLLIVDRADARTKMAALSLLRDVGLDVAGPEQMESSLDPAERVSPDLVERIQRRPRTSWKAFWVLGALTSKAQIGNQLVVAK